MNRIIRNIFIFSLFLVNTNTFSQTTYVMGSPNNAIRTTCNEIFESSGACGNWFTGYTYCANENKTVTYVSATGQSVQATFNSFDTEDGSDFLYVYDGPTVNPANLIAVLTGSYTYPPRIVSTGTSLTFKFTSDGSSNYSGWSAEMACVASCGTNELAGDNCSGATFICNLNNYCGNTSGLYTVDTPGNMTDGSSLFNGSLENNSWISFVASSTTVSLDVTVSHCTDAYGIQFGIYSGTNCNGFVLKSPLAWTSGTSSSILQNNSTSTVVTNGLTIGQTYYVMIDGYGGDVCNYKIKANSGIATPVITPSTPSVMCGGSSTLTVGGVASINGVTWTSTPTDPNLVGHENDNPLIVTPGQTTTYQARVLQGNLACPDSSSAFSTISVNPLVFTPSASQTTICVGSTSVLTSNLTGTYTYSWAATNPAAAWNTHSSDLNTIATPIVNPTVTTTYTVTVSNGACSASNTVVVNVTQVSANASVNNSSICNGVSANLSATGGGTYSWATNPSSSWTSTNNNPTVNPTTTTSYVVTVTNGLCTASDDVVVTVLPLPNANAGPDQTISMGISTSLNGSPSGAGLSYVWQPSASISGSNTIEDPNTIALAGTTLYTLTVTDNASGCSASDQVAIVITGSTLSVVASSTPLVICSGQSASLGAFPSGGSGTYDYTWTANPAYTWNPIGSDLTQNPIVSPTQTTTFTVTIDDGFATVSAQVTVVVNPLPVAFAGNDITVCQGNQATLTATGGGTYQWTNGIVNGVAFNPPATSNYTVTVTNTGCTATDVITVTVAPKPNINAGSDLNFCEGLAIVLTGTGAGTNGTYNWNNGITNGVAFTPTTTSNYIVTGTDANGCVNTDAVQISVNTMPVANAGADVTVCQGTTTTLTATGGTTYSWNIGPSTAAITVAPSYASVYIVTVSNGACSATDAVIVDVWKSPNPKITPSVPMAFCPGLNNTVTLDAGIGFDHYNWSNGDITQSTTISTVGSYTVTVTDSNNCTGNAIPFNIVNAPVFDPKIVPDGDTTFCKDSHVNLNLDTIYHTYEWSSGSTSEYIKAFEEGDYYVSVTDFYGCPGVAGPVTIIVNPKPEVYISETQSFNNVNFYNYSFFGTTFSWDFGDGSAITTQNSPSHTYPATGSYWAVCTATNACGVDKDSLLVVITSMVGIDEKNNVSNLRVYPNPFNELITVSFSVNNETDIKIKLVNTIGQEIVSTNFGKIVGRFEKQINLGDLAFGVYYLMIQTDKGNIVSKVIRN
ncbi:MAG: T9SS type A sorting domain-containing protein [Bacteroidota bacterium]